MTYKKKYPWKCKIRLIPFESIQQRDKSYELWVKSFSRCTKTEPQKTLTPFNHNFILIKDLQTFFLLYIMHNYDL